MTGSSAPILREAAAAHQTELTAVERPRSWTSAAPSFIIRSLLAGPPDIVAAYTALHRLGRAASIETWIDGTLAGGLYGVSLGRMFFGESMFARADDASKIALATLVQILRNEKVPVIDCQQNTRHLASLGAREVGRADFLAHVRTAVAAAPIDWGAYMDRPLNALLTETRTD